MAYDVFSPGLNPHFEYQKETSCRVLTANFGDGYKQEVGDGLNAIERKPTLIFSPISATVANAIETFLESKKGYIPFVYTLPDEATPRQWKCKRWPRVPVGDNQYSITMELEQDFSIP